MKKDSLSKGDAERKPYWRNGYGFMQAAERPKIRKRAKPTAASKERRLESKHRRT
jgi:hypothetical protein